jgi:NAD(P)-dependent dehydrogenase (short-subunit alcohol dehydrogenase family)
MTDLEHNEAAIIEMGPLADDAKREVSQDGYELRFAVNYLAPFLLTRLRLPLLERSAPARIVNVASAGQTPIAFDDLMLERRIPSTVNNCSAGLCGSRRRIASREM